MSAQVPQFLIRMVLVLMVVSVALAIARSVSAGEQEIPNGVDAALKPWQLEILAQRLAELTNENRGGDDFAWERAIRSPEDKRQSRFRQCYFNPVSCFRK